MYVKALINEHDRLRIMLTLMTGRATTTQERLMYFNKFKSLYAHHSKLEKVFVFEALHKHGIDAASIYKDAEHNEHQDIIDKLSEIPAESILWISLASQLRNGLNQHMSDEEALLFPLIANRVPAGALRSLNEKYKQVAL